jgi:hypothetical protein
LEGGSIARNRGQVATEFIVMVSLAMIVVMAFIWLMYRFSYDYSEEKNMEKISDLGYSLQSELILASEVEPGYERTINIPDKASGADYSISQTDNDLVLTYRGADILFAIPKVTGSLHKGVNIISKPSSNSITIT